MDQFGGFFGGSVILVTCAVVGIRQSGSFSWLRVGFSPSRQLFGAVNYHG